MWKKFRSMTFPASAFDSPAERERVSDLLDQHNEELTMGPQLDEQFREIARERTAAPSVAYICEDPVSARAHLVVYAAH